jgi:hypothetical protein
MLDMNAMLKVGHRFFGVHVKRHHRAGVVHRRGSIVVVRAGGRELRLRPVGTDRHAFGGARQPVAQEDVSTGEGVAGMERRAAWAGFEEVPVGVTGDSPEPLKRSLEGGEPVPVVGFAGVGVAMAGWSVWKKRRLAKLAEMN